ncbi:adhesion G-protein coupled receptor G6-like isoform X1 [Styela clava]
MVTINIVSAFLLLILHNKVEGQEFIASSLIVNGKRYHLSAAPDTWYRSHNNCLSHQWRLAIIKNKEQQTVLNELVSSYGKNVWIGLRMRMVGPEGGISTGWWSDGTPYNSTVSFDNWEEGEPQSKISSPCVYMWQNFSFGWDDWYCDKRFTYACEETVGLKSMSPEEFQIQGVSIMNKTLHLESNSENLKTVSQDLDNMLNANSNLFDDQQNMSRNILNSFDSFLEKYDVTKNGDFSSSKENLQINIKRINHRVDLILKDDISNKAESNLTPIRLKLSRDILNEAQKRYERTNPSQTAQVGSVLYKTPSLFQANKTEYVEKLDANNITYEGKDLEVSIFGEEPNLKLATTVLTNIISADVFHVDMSNLSSPICISVEKKDNDAELPELNNMKPNMKIRCAFWDPNLNDWSEEGCAMIETIDNTHVCHDGIVNLTTENQYIVCQCNHLTHFALIQDVEYTYAPKYLDYLTLTGCIVSAAFHFFTVITILCFKSMRTDKIRLIILHISANLFIVNVIFPIGIDDNDNEIMCEITSIALHYFMLTAWAWMLLEAVYLFHALFLSQHVGGPGAKMMVIGGLLAYVIPGAVVATSKLLSTSYRSKRYCWLSSEIINFAFNIPVGCVLVFDVVALLSAIYGMTCGLKVKRTVINPNYVRQTIVRIICMVFLLGIPWAFGFLMLLSQNETLKSVCSIIFIVCNALQGIVIFVVFCAMQEKFREKVVSLFTSCQKKTVPSIKFQERVETNVHDENAKDTLNTDTSSSLPPPPPSWQRLRNEERPYRSRWI